MADEGEDDQRKAERDSDPLDAQTEPHVTPDRSLREEVGDIEAPADAAALADLDTVTWSVGASPPAQIEARPPPPAESAAVAPEDTDATVLVRVEAQEALPEPESESLLETLIVVADAPVTDTGSKTPIAPSSSLHPMLLERIDPSLGRGERMRLDAARWRVSLGRADQNEIQLYTASASREHAVIAGNEDGDWVLTPGEGKTVKIDGDETDEPVVLEVGMNLVFGGDHLRCVRERLERHQMSAQTSAEGLLEEGVPSRSRPGLAWWFVGGVAVIGLGLILFAWMTE